MGYQVLARKWRPNRFGELVGQEHVVTAISNALDNDRLHHAYLFTGTRGVGKTTIARIFSKSLNCEQGLSSKPCGQCSTCKEIENGNFIDLLEIDAASRTKVEDTRELLDNVQYKPSRGRYKVYLIDEVHMLSKHSFNALLKTLEEPPPHVKFLLATTDPQKLPVTILSRCLQFNLKALSRTQISQQLDFILGEEGIQSDKEALSQLARAAQGSMRDALSLTDQAIAQGNGVVGLQIVTDMLGLMDKNQVLKLVHAVVQKDSLKVMQQVELMSIQAPDYGLVLAEIMSLLHQIALTQFVPDACKLETISARAIFQLAKSVPVEQIQLLYQIALTGKKDLPHAADARTGLEMTLLRMLAFSPSNLKLDALDIAAKTPDVEVAIPQSVSQTQNADVAAPVVETPVAHVTDDLVNQSEAAVEHSSPENSPVEVNEESQPSSHQIMSAEPEQHQDESHAVGQSESTDESLVAQQQDIMQQAEDFGHQPIDYDQYQPVSMEEQSAEAFSGDYPSANFENTHVENDAMHPREIPQAATQQQVDAQPSTSTADLIALRNKLKQSQRDEGEGAEQVKKSDSAAPFDLASIRKQNQEAENKPAEENNSNQKPLIPAVNHSEPSVTPVNAEPMVNTVPPWSVDNGSQITPVVSPFSAEKIIEEADIFDSSAHLDEENVGDVTLEISAFLPDQQKVIKALQVDDWSKLIEDMQVTALTKQLALHSAYNRQGDTVKLTLLETKSHLISDTAQQQLKEALCLALEGAIGLEIELGQPINTPYALQLKVNQVRKEYACEVVKNDPGIQLLQQQFAAKVDEQSIQAR
ncbi:DNA polymerase III subunit gamma/tau [uncultured Paraglaciecola sp.]|uniref:DNA polymerase III subunit gamma/tau n=1 Tax=uncultured Paraglaciecola sp. TaxID=1765024 RepID=UPI0025F39221|nr:DNA polymerase III subunit gamma/tau [uncultured Paraglaciecola sp.]